MRVVLMGIAHTAGRRVSFGPLSAALATMLLAVLALVGCGEDPIGDVGCGLGTERDCTCEDGSVGTQQCGVSGLFGVCSCEADADMGTTDIPGSDGSLDGSEDTADLGGEDLAADSSEDAPSDDTGTDTSEDLTRDDAGDGGGDGDLGDAAILDLADADDLSDLPDATSGDVGDGGSGDDPDVTASGDPDVLAGDDPDASVSRDPDVLTHADPDVVSSDDPDLFVSSDPDVISDDPDLPGPDIFGRDLGPNGPPVPGEGEVALWFDDLFVEGGGTALVSVMMNNTVPIYGAQFTVSGATLVGHPFDGRGATARWTMRGNSETGTIIAFSGSLTAIDPDNSLLFILRIQWPPDYARIDFDEDSLLLISDAVGAEIPVVTNGYTFPWP